MYATAKGAIIEALPPDLADSSDDTLAGHGIYHVRESTLASFDSATQALTMDGAAWGYDESGSLPVITLAWAVRSLTEAELLARARARRPEIVRRLHEIDAASIRPARAVAAALAQGSAPDPADVAKVAALDAEAQALRGQLVPEATALP
ncbi:hypothetical protein [Pararhodospirillum photometricum]|uniref:Uncharacterized protein n=1 Tax=Pararhodospirillum photometricum DSM 122 TaxID=1150469 RepID=H6SIW0_PARPM|nr:hypothetical protein [Pararhodospirillum photometricum]CCG07925.1 unnamed protein product [Pararhodospirillum photometricum DSM 122]